MKNSRTGRVFLVLLSLVMVLGIIAVGTDRVAAATDPTTGLIYTISSGVAEISGFTVPAGFSGSLQIPDTLGGSPVTSIADYAFDNCQALTSVMIINNSISIGDGAFYYCNALTSAGIGTGVTSIGELAFGNCSALTQIMVSTNNPNYSSQDGVLFNKVQTTLIQCPCGKAGSYVSPVSVTTFESGAFTNCSKLTSVSIGIGVTNVGSSPFAFCDGLTDISVHADNTAYSASAGVLFNKTKTTLIRCPSGKTGSYVIPGSVKTVDYGSFARCTGLTGVTIPNGVTMISGQAFEYCSGLTNVTIPASVTTIINDAFGRCTGLSQFIADEGNAQYASENGVLFNKAKTTLFLYPCGKTGSYVIPNSVTSIGGSAFSNCSGLTGVTIPGSVTSIGSYAFAYCTGLTGAAILKNVTNIGNGAFSHCSVMTAIYFYGNAPTMGTNVFAYSASALTVYYLRNSTGYSNPWNGYPSVAFDVGITYQTHVQDIGWQDYVSNGATSGTSGQSRRLEAIRINVVNLPGSIEYKTHVQDIGWMDWAADGALSGTSAQSKRLEAIQIRLTGTAAEMYDVYYRVHAQEFGWLDWAKNGASAGTAGYSYRLEAIQMVLVPKGAAAPGAEIRPYVDLYSPTGVRYQTHVQDIGWQDYVANGAVSGTSGQSKRLEAIHIMLEGIAGGIEYKTHVQDIGWMDWAADGALSGTSGQSKRLEAIQIRLTGAAASLYDVYYCVHAQNTGWLDWAKNGESAGTAGFSYRLEAIKVVLVLKGGAAPGPTTRAFVQG